MVFSRCETVSGEMLRRISFIWNRAGLGTKPHKRRNVWRLKNLVRSPISRTSQFLPTCFLFKSTQFTAYVNMEVNNLSVVNHLKQIHNSCSYDPYTCPGVHQTVLLTISQTFREGSMVTYPFSRARKWNRIVSVLGILEFLICLYGIL